MEGTNEADLVANISPERTEATNELCESTSFAGKTIEESQITKNESSVQQIITADEQSLENNLHDQPISDEPPSYLEINRSDPESQVENRETAEQTSDAVENVTESASAGNQESANISEVTEIVMAIEDHTETKSVVTNVESTEESQENVTLEEKNPHEEQKSTSSDYAREYMLENRTEEVYMPEQANVVPDEVYSTEMISDDSQDNSAVLEQESNQQNSVAAEEGAQISEKSTDLQYETEKQKNEKQTSEIQSNECHVDDTRHDSVKIECADSEKYDNVSEVDNQSVDESIDNEAFVSGNLVVEDTPAEEEAVERRIEDGKVSQVKEEVHLLEAHENHPAVSKTQEGEIVNQPVEQQDIVDVHNELTENLEVTDAPVTSSENISLESYALPEDLEVTEIQEEYTIVEAPSSLDISVSRQSEENNSDGALVLLQNYESSEDIMQMSDEQAYLTELRNQAESRQSTSSQSSDAKPRRGRKPTFDIPMHVLGHDISKPVETVPNGRALPKPRLGVKVPYRNLTSQIVSKAEIEKEIMERARMKQEQANARGDVLFARKLTQRLARKIAPSPNHPKRVVGAAVKPKECELQPQNKEPETPSSERKTIDGTEVQDSSKIHNDSDLLAILEGEGEEMLVLPKETSEPNVDETNLKMLEREIALQQLQELPHQAPKPRIFKAKQTKATVYTAEVSSQATNKVTEKGSVTKDISASTPVPQSSTAKQKVEQPPHTLSDKENTSKQPANKETMSVSPKKDSARVDLSSPIKQPVEIEPQVKVNMVLKTYSRKRKTVELPEPFPESPVSKKPMLTENEIKTEKADPAIPPDAYITKSSRVIKRKVIWDPDDEVPSRSPKPSGKNESQSPKAALVKPAKPVDKNAEKIVEKKPMTEKVIKEKPPEKKANEKPVPKKNVTEKPASPEKKPSKNDSPKTSKTPLKNKKNRSEVDKLLMDEGAVKMLYELKNTDDVPPAKKKKDVYSVERAQKEIIKKANEIKTDLQQNTSNESPKSLRKKETLPTFVVKPVQPGSIERKLSKDSTRSSLHTPPGSPPYSFPHSQGSMLVRRRSSSSISSSDEANMDDSAKISKKKPVSSSEVSRPKKTKKNEDVNELIEEENPDQESSPKPTTVDNKLNQFKSFTVKKTNKHVTIDLNYVNDKCYCTVQVLEELTATLKKFAKDKDCNVVTITSSSKAFCLGLQYTSLLSDKEDVRKKNATELAARVRDFLLCLLNFPKVLIAGIQGECMGLGVTMLPLFDMVIASDTAMFSTPYATLGCIAEAGFLLSSPHLTNHGLAAELLYTPHKLTADDAFRRGLISRLCWPEKYNETLKNIVTSVSKGSKQSLEATKKQLRHHIVQTTEAAINSESKLLIEHWTSAECQKNFTKLLENGN